MTDITTDVISALREEIDDHINAISELSKKGIYIYSPDQIETSLDRVSMPCILYHYSGIQQGGNKMHQVYFDIYLAAKSESLSQIKGHRAIPLATEVLQKLRKRMACYKSVSGRHWHMVNEIPDYAGTDTLLFRQRWYTEYVITN